MATTTKRNAPSGTCRKETTTHQASTLAEFAASQNLNSAALDVTLRYEEDVAEAYRAWYKDQVVYDRRHELGRFLFGVSSASIGTLVALLRLNGSPWHLVTPTGTLTLLSLGMLVVAALCGVYLAIPRHQVIDPDGAHLVELHRQKSAELKTVSGAWLIFWLGGLVAGISALLTL